MKYFKYLFIIFIFYSSASAQYQNIQITNAGSPEEVSICINPKNPDIIVAACNITKYFVSTNKGISWTSGNLTSSAYGVWGDPCVLVDTNGHFYYIHLSSPPSGGHWIDRIVVQKSTNNGYNWSNPGTYTFYDPNKDQDKAWGAIDRNNNYIYITWTQFDSYGTSNQSDSSNILFARSTDGGLTWNQVKRINKIPGDCVDSYNTVEGAVPCVGPNGEVYDSWSGPLVRNSDFRIFFNKSTDYGVTWLANPINAAVQQGGWDFPIAGIYRANGMPITCCDLSNSSHRGNIYINYADQGTSSIDHDIKFVKSTDGGNTWSAPKRVNNDSTTHEQFFTWMTVDQANGHIYVVF